MREFNVLTSRKCPKCNSADYRKSVTYARITVRKNGKSIRTLDKTDAGSWKCLKCDFEEMA